GDLAAYRAKERAPICAPYRAWRVCGMGPPSSGGLTIGEILGTLEPYDLAALGPRDPAAWRLIANASQLAFADRERYMADSDFVPMPTAGLLDRGYLKGRAALLKTDRALQDVQPGHPQWSHAENYGDGDALELPSTSHFSIVDAAGNVVSVTSSIESAFGARIMVDGFLLNNELTDFSFESHDAAGRPIANRVEPGKRPRSSMSPTFVLNKDRELVVAVGSAGGQRIIGDTLQALIGMLDWNLSAQAALDLPRVLNMNGPTELEDKGDLPAQAERLRALGHEVQVRRHEGGLTAIRREGDGWGGGADPRRNGVAKAD
ncbi:MAG: gamma-glutamyltransferase family protein, partial [Sciscionella sp.]